MRTRKQVTFDVEVQKCDRCGTEQLEPGVPRIIFLSASFAEAGIDLCVPCMQDVKAFIKTTGVPRQ